MREGQPFFLPSLLSALHMRILFRYNENVIIIPSLGLRCISQPLGRFNATLGLVGYHTENLAKV